MIVNSIGSGRALLGTVRNMRTDQHFRLFKHCHREPGMRETAQDRRTDAIWKTGKGRQRAAANEQFRLNSLIFHGRSNLTCISQFCIRTTL